MAETPAACAEAAAAVGAPAPDAAPGAVGSAGLQPSEAEQGMPAAADVGVAGTEEAGEDQAALQAAVLLFCRAGGQPYTFCGRLLPAVVGGLPAGAAQSGGGPSSCCITWELADADALLAGGSAAAQLPLPVLRVSGGRHHPATCTQQEAPADTVRAD